MPVFAVKHRDQHHIVSDRNRCPERDQQFLAPLGVRQANIRREPAFRATDLLLDTHKVRYARRRPDPVTGKTRDNPRSVLGFRLQEVVPDGVDRPLGRVRVVLDAKLKPGRESGGKRGAPAGAFLPRVDKALTELKSSLYAARTER